MGSKKNKIPVHRPKTESEFRALNRELNEKRYIAIDLLKPGKVRDISLAFGDPAASGANDMANVMGCGQWSNGPLVKVAWAFDEREETVVKVYDTDGKTELGLGYVKWGPGNSTPSVIPPLAQASPYTAAPLRYIADLISGLGPRLMYRFPDGTLVEFKNAGERLKNLVCELERQEQAAADPVVDGINGVVAVATGGEQPPRKESDELKSAREALDEWKRVWLGYDDTDDLDIKVHVPGAKDFIEENNLNMHLSQCMQDNVMLDIYFPTVGFNTLGHKGSWDPKITRLSFLPAYSCRLSKMTPTRHIDAVYFSDQWRTLGAAQPHTANAGSQKIAMYPAAMPQSLLHELRYIVESHQKGRIKDRPMWVVCPTYYPSLNKPYYPQPAWWSVFASKAFDFSATILYDKYKARENNTTWGRIIYISLDYLNQVFADEGYSGNSEAQQKFVDDLDKSMEDFLQRRENNGKTMRQFMWLGPDGKQHHNIEVVDITEAKQDAVKAGKEELELSTSPIFLALQVDPRLVGVPMVAASNGGTALREMHLLKQQQLNVHQRNYCFLLDSIFRFNKWDCGGRAEWHIKQQTLTTLDNSKTGVVETIAGEGA